MSGWVRVAALLGLLASVCVAHAAPADILVDAQGLGEEQVRASQALVEVTASRLPPGFLARLDDPPTLRWRDDLPENVHGRARGDDLGLRRDLLQGWQRQARQGEKAAGSDPAVVALLHELAHVHDRSAKGGVSRDPRFLDLAGWPVQPLRFGLRKQRNDFSTRVPDAYELTSPAEFFAVNFEHFLLDPDYACRRPALHRYFSNRFDWSPPSSPCPPDQVFVAGGEDGEALRVANLSADRVYQVDYLYAEANSRPMSRWGHSMLRLVVCAPGRPLGPDCRLDLDHHLVLSFRAYVDDLQISSWRGLTGSYPSRLFVLPLNQVVDEYTKVELRGLQSIPLELTRSEVGTLLERAARMHWSYDGRYYFVSNNCAVETWKLLNDGVPRLSALPLRSITPNGLLRRLDRGGIADTSVLVDRSEALRMGYRFESQAAYFDEMFAVADAELRTGHAGAIAWMDADPSQRRPFLEGAGTRASAALLLLEHAALRRLESKAREVLKQRYLRGGAASQGDVPGDVRQALARTLEEGGVAGQPSALLGNAGHGGYGLPQADERAALLPAVARLNQEVPVLREILQQHARTVLPADLVRMLDASNDNIVLIGQRLRQLDGQADRTH